MPDVPIEQETKEEQHVTQEKDEEVRIYQEELQGRKDIDIFCSVSYSSVHGPSQARNRRTGNVSPEKF